MFRGKQSPAHSNSDTPQAAHTGAKGEITATVRSWEKEFSGSAASLLREALEIWMKSPIGSPYARSLAIIQSSGTGKSRMNDELAKQIVYVPMVLSERTNVFPPADTALISWILARSPLPENNRRQLWVARRMYMFLIALLNVTDNHLQALVSELALGESCSTKDATLQRLAQLAEAFRKKLAEGRTWGTQGPYRTSFYEAVVKMADELIEEDPITGETPVGIDTYESLTKSLGSRVIKAGDAVRGILSPSGHEVPQPLLVLLFDEANSLTEDERGWSRYNELRRALSSASTRPIFSIFLSTSGSVHQIFPAVVADPSLRISSGSNIAFPPFTETGYDELAIKVSTEGDWLLEHVASTEYMCHLGRPLFAPRYEFGDEEVKSMMIAFAAEKLIAKTPYPGHPLDPDAKLACVSVLLGLEFRDTIWSRQAERKQVERHMRLVTDGRPETMRTVSPSEPILAEGAHYVMRSGYATALDSHFQSTYLSTGERGEAVAALLIILARQLASSPPVVPQPCASPFATSLRHPMLKDPSDSGRRVLSLLDFLRALLRPADFENVRDSVPTRFQEGDNKPFRDIFSESWVYFNHCIKASNFDVVNQKGLVRIIPRGGILICANNMRAVDLIIPVTFKGTALRPDNITAVLIQVKNDLSFTDKMRTLLFTAMDPIDLGLFADSSPALPVVRMVFALASSQPIVDIPVQAPRKTRLDKYTAFDIWCAGCCDETFKVISANENATYQSLLNRTVDHSSTYEVDSNDDKITEFKEHAAASRRTMYPGAANDPAHWSRYMGERKGGEEAEGAGLMDTSE